MPAHVFATARVSCRNLPRFRRQLQARWKRRLTTATSTEELASANDALGRGGSRSSDAFTFADAELGAGSTPDADSVCMASLTLSWPPILADHDQKFISAVHATLCSYHPDVGSCFVACGVPHHVQCPVQPTHHNCFHHVLSVQLQVRGSRDAPFCCSRCACNAELEHMMQMCTHMQPRCVSQYWSNARPSATRIIAG